MRVFYRYHFGDCFCSYRCRMKWHDARRRRERAEDRQAQKNIEARLKDFYENYDERLCHESFFG